MSATPPVNAASQKAEKPTLSGTRIRQRKGVAKSQAKFEPEDFRDQLLKFLDGVPENDWDGLLSALDKAGNTLDYRKYSDQFFEIFFTGGLLAPGGSYLDEDVPLSKHSVFAAKAADVEHIKPIIVTLEKLIRRFKFLQKPLEETNLSGLIQYTSRYAVEERQKLAVATALLIQMGLVNANVLLTLQKDHLVKDDVALHFIDICFRAFLAEQNVDALGSALRKGGVKEPLLFFPLTRRSQPGLVGSHFRTAGLPQVADYFQKRAVKETRDHALNRIKTMRGATVDEKEVASDEDLVDFFKDTRERNGLAHEDYVSIVWEALLSVVIWDENAEKHDVQTLKEVKAFAPILEPFCSNPKSEIALINTIQVNCHEDSRMTRAFPNILKVLYNDDVISDQAIIYWAQKGAKPQGKAHFLKITEPLIKFLEEQSDDEEE